MEGSCFLLFSPWSHFGHSPCPIFVLWLVGFEFMQKLYAALGNLFTDSWGWQSFVSSCDVFNSFDWMYKMPSRFFCYSWLILFAGFLFEKWASCQSNRKSDFRWHPIVLQNALLTSPCLTFIFERVEKSQVILALLDGFLELHLDW